MSKEAIKTYDDGMERIKQIVYSKCNGEEDALQTAMLMGVAACVYALGFGDAVYISRGCKPEEANLSVRQYEELIQGDSK